MSDVEATPHAQAMPAETAPVQPIEHRGIRLVLLDIEGTTCPVRFVTHTLFPYASRAMKGFLEAEAGQKHDAQRLVDTVRQSWVNDADPAARKLRERNRDDVSGYLSLLIQQDRKLTALKELQGLVWQAGYDSGELVAPLFADVPDSLRNWKDQGLTLAVYSSGSVTAQKLLYSHTTAGDLSMLFGHWFDTTVGPKSEIQSYIEIASQLALQPQRILFISDSTPECRAAHAAGMAVLFSSREGNQNQNTEGFREISDFRQLVIQPA
jgi:enolase-phosphatase E1